MKNGGLTKPARADRIGGQNSLINRNVYVKGHRTSVRLEPEMWAALQDISRREECRIHDLCSLVSLRKRGDCSLTAAIRVFVMLYYRAAATEEGHVRAGHGNLQRMIMRAGGNRDGAVRGRLSQDVSSVGIQLAATG